uniref:ShTK domain protein n=1 Tax=Haemonchus placei TaxID=6290 RepID=A0A0N4WK05_HAEPC
LITNHLACVDKVNAATGVSDCASMIGYCNNSVYYTLMTEQCPKTCGRCSSTSSSSNLSSTTTCVDKVNTATGVSDCSRLASYCRVASYVTLMQEQCPRTCGYCCVDRVNSHTGKSDCPYVSRLCGDSKYSQLMRTQCPKTCGFCSVDGSTVTPLYSGECRDLVNAATGKSDCGKRSQLCRNPIYKQLMSQQCPKTCGCFDRVDSRTGKSACPYMVRLCGDGRYRTVMQEQCPKTCGFCSVGGTTMTPLPYTGCQDLVNGATGKSDCGSRYEYCKNPLYMELMAQQCPKTCGYCS